MNQRIDLEGFVPSYLLSANGVPVTHVVLSVGTFGADERETLLPCVEQALQRVQESSGAEICLSYYLRAWSADQVVKRVNDAIVRAKERGKSILWIRADDEDYARAALAVMRTAYDVSICPSAKDEIK